MECGKFVEAEDWTRRGQRPAAFPRMEADMDWTPIEIAFIGAAATVISASAAVAAGYIRAHVRNQEAAAVIVRTETMAAGIAHDALTTAVANGVLDWAAAKQVAIREGIVGVQRELAMDVTPLAVAAALAPMLAANPSVPSGNASVAAAVSCGGEALAVVALPDVKPIDLIIHPAILPDRMP